MLTIITKQTTVNVIDQYNNVNSHNKTDQSYDKL